jgi:hypothetical protein
MELALTLLALVILAQTAAIVLLVWVNVGKPKILPVPAKSPNAPVPMEPKVAFWHGVGAPTPERKS